QQAVVPATPAAPGLIASFECSSQSPYPKCCDDRLNPPDIRLNLWFLPRAFLLHGGHGYQSIPGLLCALSIQEGHRCSTARTHQRRGAADGYGAAETYVPFRRRAGMAARSAGTASVGCVVAIDASTASPRHRKISIASTG